MIHVFIENKDVSRFIVKEGFPDEIEYSIKGEGYFDFEVRPFTFKILYPIVLDKAVFEVSTGQKVEIKNVETGEVFLKGVIDSIEEDNTYLREITVYPEVLWLKDTIIGDEVDIGEDEPAKDFCPGQVLSVREIVGKVLKYVNAEKNTSFKVTSETCPDPENENRSFFGNILRRVKRSGLVYGLWNIVIDVLNLNFRFHFRKKSNSLYLVESDVGFFFKKVWDKGSWLKFKFQIPPKDILGVKKGEWVNLTLELPPFNIYFPTIGAKFHIYKCVAGGLEKVETQDFFPLFPFYDFTYNLDKYGNKIYTKTCSNITNTRVEAFLKEKKYRNIEVITAIDLDENNSYIYAEAQKEGKLLEYEDLILSFETMSDFYYYVHYRNAKAIDILKDLCKVTDRWLYVDFEGKVYLLPVNQTGKNITIPERNILSISKTKEKAEDFVLSLNRLIETEDGIDSFGIRLRNAEYEALERYYQKKLEREKEITELRAFNVRADLLDDCQYGTITEIKRSLKEPIINVKAERFQNGKIR